MSSDQPSDQRGADALLVMPVAALGRALRDGALSPVDLGPRPLCNVSFG